MKKIISAAMLPILFFLISLSIPLSSFAQEVGSGITGKVISPIPINQNNNEPVIIHITSNADGTFTDSSNVTYLLTIFGPDNSRIFLSNRKYALQGVGLAFEDLSITDNGREIIAEVRSGLIKKAGNWTYRLSAKPGGILYDEGQFTVHQNQVDSGGTAIGGIQIGLFSPVRMFEQMDITLTNVFPDETYTVYFDGSQTTEYIGTFEDAAKNGIAGIKTVPVPNPNVAGETIDGYQAAIKINAGGPKKGKVICVRIGKPLGIFGLNCEYASAPFDVIAGVPMEKTFLPSGVAGTPEGQSCNPLQKDPFCPPGSACQPAYNPGIDIGDSKDYESSHICKRTYDSDTSILSFSALTCAKGLTKKDKENKREVTTNAEEIEICQEVKTAIGPISTNPAEFVRSIFSIVLGLAGGIATILIMISGYKFMVSQGNPEKMADAREHLTSAVVGLLFIIFSFVILQVIGVDILRIPGFQP